MGMDGILVEAYKCLGEEGIDVVGSDAKDIEPIGSIYLCPIAVMMLNFPVHNQHPMLRCHCFSIDDLTIYHFFQVASPTH